MLSVNQEIRIGIRMGLWAKAVAPAGEGEGGWDIDPAVDDLVDLLVSTFNKPLEDIHAEFHSIKPRTWQANPVLFGHMLGWRCAAMPESASYTIGDGPRTVDERIPGFSIKLKDGELKWHRTGTTAQRWMSLEEHNRRAEAARFRK